MSETYHYVPQLLDEVAAAPAESIVSRTLYQTEGLKGVLFSFAAGQALTEHTASVPAILQVLSGEARLTLGRDSYAAGAGAWMYMPAGLPHSVLAQTPTQVLLLLLKAKPAG